jgi:hypothetical protein
LENKSFEITLVVVSKRVEISLGESSKKEIVGKQYKNCESQIKITKGHLF